ncbi:MAG: glutamyl-tRNA synthetase [Thermoleophilaceae bacterium]|nr:glutamyl-tRNA synthetase [Thermoleophilaceae bacterium]
MRVRFAPSPTGELHIGGARTALYNWLLARGSGGTLVLRIEDTDRERSTPENVDQILDALRWLGLDWDEGPISQVERSDRHRAEIARLVEEGHAYMDDGAVRLRVPEGQTVVHDLIRGDVEFDNSAIDDFVIARSDGSALYNLAVAVDDRDMEITQVVRGEDHLSNTPRQLMVMKALGITDPPAFAHLPLLHGPDGKKLSKRHGAASVQELRDAGYLPAAVRNYIALLGWGYDAETTFFTTEEMAQKFSLDRVSKSPAIFDEQKLRWMNGHYLREMDIDELTAILEEQTGHTGLRPAVELSREKFQTLSEFWPLAGFFVERRPFDEKAWAKVMKDDAPERLERARAILAEVEPFDAQSIESALRGLVEELGVKPMMVFQPVRVAISGGTISPGIFESLALLGKEETLSRIDAALAHAGR